MKNLTEKQKAFCRGYFEHGNAGKAYRDVYGKSKELKAATCDAAASRLLRNVKVREYLAELNAQLEEEAIMSKKERMRWLTRVVRTPAGKVDADSDLCQSITTTDGEMGSSEKITMPSKIAAIAELNKMDGAYEPEKIEVRSEFSFASLLDGLPSEPLVNDLPRLS